MYENQSWLPVASLFGLVGCSVPGDLKAEILRTLATFALSPEIASNMWVTLEVSQVRKSALLSVDGLAELIVQQTYWFCSYQSYSSFTLTYGQLTYVYTTLGQDWCHLICQAWFVKCPYLWVML